MAELEVKYQQVSQGGILPPIESVLAALDIDTIGIQSIKPRWKRTQYRAVLNWLIEYKPQPDANNLEQVRGYLEAFHHLCEVEDWERAKIILRMRINTPSNEELHNQLGTWGYYREQINIYEKLLDQVSLNENLIFNQQEEGHIMNDMGNAYYGEGNFQRAIDYYQGALEISREIDDIQLEAKALGNLGNISNYQGNFEQSIEYVSQQLQIAREIGDLQLEAKALGSLGNTYNLQGKYPQAIDYYERELKIERQINNRYEESKILGSLGMVYSLIKEHDRAINFLDKSLKIARIFGDRDAEFSATINLGDTYNHLGEPEKALSYHDRALNIAREIGNSIKEAMALGNLGETRIKLKQYSEARENLETAIDKLRKVSYPYAEASFLKILAELYQELGDRDLALDYCNQALAIATEYRLPLAQECQMLESEIAQAEEDLLSEDPTVQAESARLAYQKGDYQTIEEYIASRSDSKP